MGEAAVRQHHSGAFDAAQQRRQRLDQLLKLAIAYKDWTRKELARALGRDPTKLIPGTGIPKLDLVVELAGVLDWPVGDVVAFLWNRQPEEIGAGPKRAGACYGEAVAWKRRGRYIEAAAALARGLAEPGLATEARRVLQADLAHAYYTLWSLVEAGSISRELHDYWDTHPPGSPSGLRGRALARFVSGQTARRLIGVEPNWAGQHAGAARRDLAEAMTLHERLAHELGDESHHGAANTCAGAMIEADVALERLRPDEALDTISAGLDQARDPAHLSGARLESYGWWCIYGCNIALRHLDDERALQQHMAVFTNKADEIANRLDDWPMRERVFTMQYTRWERAAGSTCFEIPCVIDSDDVRVIAGTMGRFPAFRRTGWRILQTAQIIDGR